jgi:hypothetical protein
MSEPTDKSRDDLSEAELSNVTGGFWLREMFASGVIRKEKKGYKGAELEEDKREQTEKR